MKTKSVLHPNNSFAAQTWTPLPRNLPPQLQAVFSWHLKHFSFLVSVPTTVPLPPPAPHHRIISSYKCLPLSHFSAFTLMNASAEMRFIFLDMATLLCSSAGNIASSSEPSSPAVSESFPLFCLVVYFILSLLNGCMFTVKRGCKGLWG